MWTLPTAGLTFLAALLTASLWLWTVLARRRGEGLPILADAGPPPRVESVVVLAAITIWLSGPFVARALFPAEPSPIERVQMVCLSQSFVVLFVPLILAEGGRKSLVEYGIHRDRWRRDVVVGLAGFVASAAPVAVVIFVTSPMRKPEAQNALLKLLRQEPNVAVVAWVTLAAVVLAPLAEELLFRVLVQGWLRARYRARGAIVLAAVGFSFVHGFVDAWPLLPLALILGYVFDRTRSYLAVVVLHAAFNLTNLIAALLIAPAEADPLPPAFARFASLCGLG